MLLLSGELIWDIFCRLLHIGDFSCSSIYWERNNCFTSIFNSHFWYYSNGYPTKNNLFTVSPLWWKPFWDFLELIMEYAPQFLWNILPYLIKFFKDVCDITLTVHVLKKIRSTCLFAWDIMQYYIAWETWNFSWYFSWMSWCYCVGHWIKNVLGLSLLWSIL